MKQYFQDGFRDGDGDVVIHQFTEFTRPSGLIIPDHISTVAIESQIATEDLVQMMPREFHYEPDARSYGLAEVIEAPKILRFSLDPRGAREFGDESASVIVEAYRALTYHDIPPRLTFETTKQANDVSDDDRQTIQFVAQLVSDIINEVDRTPLPGSGMYI